MRTSLKLRQERGTVHPLGDVASVRPDDRNVYRPEDREFRGGGARLCSGDTLMARITPCLENGKIACYVAKELGPAESSQHADSKKRGEESA